MAPGYTLLLSHSWSISASMSNLYTAEVHNHFVAVDCKLRFYFILLGSDFLTNKIRAKTNEVSVYVLGVKG